MILANCFRWLVSILVMRLAARDLRFAARLLLGSPGVTVIAVTWLAFGMGATTAVFTIVAAVVFRPQDFRGPQMRRTSR